MYMVRNRTTVSRIKMFQQRYMIYKP